MGEVRKAKRLPKRNIDVCEGCLCYKYCGMRMNNEIPKGVYCHTDISTITMAQQNYFHLVKKTVTLRKVSYSSAIFKVKKWVKTMILDLKPRDPFSITEITSKEAQKINNIIQKFL